jgi:hypothetical protein
MKTCPRCHRELLDLAEQADKVRAFVAGAVVLAQGGSEMERAYGGLFGLRRVLEEQLLKAEGLARTAACIAGICIIPSANDPANWGEP